MKRILLIDDHPLLRRGVAQLIEDEPFLALAGEAGDGRSGVELARREAPDLILLDLNMAGMGGVETISALRGAGVRAQIVVLTVSDSHDDLTAAMNAGADGYLLKDMEPEDLLRALSRSAAGRKVISEAVAQTPESGTHGAEGLEGLTAREVDILRGLARGQANKQIARDLDMAEGTVKVHVRNVLRKLALRSRVEAALWAAEHGLK